MKLSRTAYFIKKLFGANVLHLNSEFYRCEPSLKNHIIFYEVTLGCASREKVYSGVEVLLLCYAIFLSIFLPANLPSGVSIDLSTHCQFRQIHHNLSSLALRGHCYSIILRACAKYIFRLHYYCNGNVMQQLN